MNFPPTKESWDLLIQQNLVVRDWALDVKKKIKASAQRFTLGKSGTVTRPSPTGPLIKKFPNVKSWKEHKLKDRVDNRFYQKFGLTEGIGFSIQQHGVFADKGVGRGYQMRGGMVVRVDGRGVGLKKESRKPVNAPIKRFPVDWFNVVVDANTRKLADDVALINENAVVNSLRLRIN
jgi:hypothetical protein